MRSFLKDLSRIGTSKIIMVSASLGTSILTARTLGPANNGLISALLVFPNLLMTVGSLGVQQATTFLVGQKKFDEQEIKKTIVQIWLLSASLSVVICYFLILAFAKEQYTNLQIALALIPVPFALYNTYNSGYFLGKNKIKEFNQINWIPSILTLLGSVYALLILKPRIEGYMTALILGPLFITVVMLTKNKFFKAFSLQVNTELLKTMLRLGLTYAIALLVINLNYSFDVILVNKWSSPYYAGIYSKAANFTQFLWQIPMLMSTIVFARSAASNDGYAFSLKVAHLLRVSSVLILMGCIFFALFADVIIELFFGSAFAESANVVRLLLPGVFFLNIFKVMNMDLAGKGLPWVSLKAMLPAFLINLFCNYYFVPKYNANGAAIASSISYTAAAFLFLHFYSKQVKIPIRKILSFSFNDYTQIFSEIRRKK